MLETLFFAFDCSYVLGNGLPRGRGAGIFDTMSSHAKERTGKDGLPMGEVEPVRAADVRAVKPDALTPAETLAKAEALGVSKAAMASGRCFLSAMLAGAFIAFGALYFCMVMADGDLPFAAQRILGGICFCLGLVLVLCCGAELFTGNILLVCAKASGKVPWSGVLRNWGLVWLGNLTGALVAVALVQLAQIGLMNGGEVGQAMVSVAAGKVVLDPVPLFFKAVLCNVFVCLAVWIGFAARTVTDKVIGILLPISAFVACGFEHCVANMFFLVNGLVANAAGFGAPGAVEVAGIAYNLALSTAGNIVGGVLVGLAYWCVYRARQS